ncbi:MAG: hypothetical protein VB096_04885 [Pseudoflavonifractor sp.]|nr:hypothetical protein [Pseudoflavonifractor sp.]
MDALAGSILAAGAAVVAAIIAGVFGSRKIDKDLAVHEEKDDQRKLILSSEHQRILGGQDGVLKDLTQVHGALSKDLTQVQGALSKDIAQIQDTVTYLKEDRMKELWQRENMKGQSLEMQNAVNVLQAGMHHIAEREARLVSAEKDLAAAEKKLAAAVEELAQLRKENAVLRQELSQGQERDDWEQEQ